LSQRVPGQATAGVRLPASGERKLADDVASGQRTFPQATSPAS